MITILDKDTDIFSVDSSALVVPVNIQGIAGKGLAAQFKYKYPNWFKDYNQDCRDNTLLIGNITTYFCPSTQQYFINFPTKTNWRLSSKLSYIVSGLEDLCSLVEFINMYESRHQICSIAFPALGCGLGGLQFEDVRKQIEYYTQDLSLQVYLIPPKE